MNIVIIENYNDLYLLSNNYPRCSINNILKTTHNVRTLIFSSFLKGKSFFYLLHKFQNVESKRTINEPEI